MLDRLAAIAADSERIALLADGDPATPVPSCPEWTLIDLVGHIGNVQRFWAAAVRAGASETPPEFDWIAPTGTDLSAWMRASTALLLDALREAGDGPCWAWWPEPRVAGAVARHQVQEAAVHRWDVEATLGSPEPLAADVADDGVAEFLAMMVDTSGLAGGVRLLSTDTNGEWVAGPGAVVATVRATASDLVLLLYKRVPTTAVEIAGERGAVDELLGAIDAE